MAAASVASTAGLRIVAPTLVSATQTPASANAWPRGRACNAKKVAASASSTSSASIVGSSCWDVCRETLHAQGDWPRCHHRRRLSGSGKPIDTTCAATRAQAGCRSARGARGAFRGATAVAGRRLGLRVCGECPRCPPFRSGRNRPMLGDQSGALGKEPRRGKKDDEAIEATPSCLHTGSG